MYTVYSSMQHAVVCSICSHAARAAQPAQQLISSVLLYTTAIHCTTVLHATAYTAIYCTTVINSRTLDVGHVDVVDALIALLRNSG